MPVELTCSCGKKLRVPDTLRGKKGRCPGCKGILDIPAEDAPPPEPQMPEAPPEEEQAPPQDEQVPPEEEQAPPEEAQAEAPPPPPPPPKKPVMSPKPVAFPPKFAPKPAAIPPKPVAKPAAFPPKPVARPGAIPPKPAPKPFAVPPKPVAAAPKPGLAKPALAKPGLAKPGLAKPALARPGLAKPGLAKPALARPGLAKPGLSRPGSKPGFPGAKASGRVTALMAPPGLSLFTKLVAVLLILGGGASIALAVLAEGPVAAATTPSIPTEGTVPDVPVPDVKAPDAKAPDVKAPDAKAPETKPVAGSKGAPPSMKERLLAGVPGVLGILSGLMILARMAIGRILGMLLGLALAGGAGFAAYKGFAERPAFVQELHKNFPALTNTIAQKWPDSIPTGVFFSAPAALGLLLLFQMLTSGRSFKKPPAPMSDAARTALKKKGKPQPEEDEEPPPEEDEGEAEGEGEEGEPEEEAPPEEGAEEEEQA